MINVTQKLHEIYMSFVMYVICILGMDKSPTKFPPLRNVIKKNMKKSAQIFN
jgi:hypothetical protein